MKWINKSYPQSTPQRFGVCLSFYCCFFLALLQSCCYSFHRTKWRLVTSICRGPGPFETKMPFFFSPKFKSAANFSAPAEEGNLFVLSGRSARKKIHNFPIKSSHLCRTSRHVWLSSSACDHCLLRLPTNLHLKLETLLWWQLALTRRVQRQKWPVN